MTQRQAPQLRPGAVAIGAAVSLVLALVLAPSGTLAVAVAIAAGALVAGAVAKKGGVMHGAVVGAASILLIPLFGGESVSGNSVIAETMTTMAVDVLYLVIAAVAGWVGARGVRGR